MAATKTAELQAMFAPSPQTKRGYGVQMDSCTKTGQFIYCNGKNVFIRSVSNPSSCDIFSDHKCNVSVAKFSPNSEWVASGDSRGRVFIWGLRSKIIKIEVNVCRDVLDLAWSDDGKRIVAVGNGSETFAKAFMWDSGSTVGDITNHSKSILSVAIRPCRPYRVATASEDRQINIYAGPPFRFDKMHDRHTRYPNQVRFSPDGEFLISVGSDKSIMVFDGKTGTFQSDLSQAGCSPDTHQGSIWSFAWAPDSKHILTVSGDSTAKIWNVPEAKVIQTYSFGDDGTTSHQQIGCVWHDESTLITVSLNGSINFLNRDKLVRIVRGHSVAVSALTVDLNNRIAYSGDSRGSIYRWNPFTNEVEELTSVGNGAENIVDLAVTPDSGDLCSAAFDDVIRTNVSGPACALPGQAVAMVAGSGSLVVVVTRAKQVVVMVSAEQVCILEVSFTPSGVALSPDQAQVAVSGTKLVHLYALDPVTHRLAPSGTLDQHTDNTTAVAYSPDGRVLCSADAQRSVYIWDRLTGTVCNPSGWRYHAARVNSVCFSPCSRALATCSVDQTVQIYTDLIEFQPTRVRIDPAHTGGVTAVRFIDSTHLVSIGDDRAVKLWSIQ